MPHSDATFLVLASARPAVERVDTSGGVLDFALLNTEDTISRLLALVRDAKQRVVLVSPYVTLAAEDRVGHAIREVLNASVKVHLIVRADQQTNPKKDWLTAVTPLVAAGLELFGVPALHAKLYYSESAVLVTSLNLLGSSFLNTIEIGLSSNEPSAVAAIDEYVAKYIRKHAQRIDADATREPLTREKGARAPKSDQGYCIRCGRPVPFDARRPYCREDFADWNEWGNEDYVDRFCHGCGKNYPATMRHPRCDSCFRQGL